MTALDPPRTLLVEERARVGGNMAVRIAVIVWAALLTCGFGWLSWHEVTAGASPSLLPARLPLDTKGRPVLVMFAHPRCPCTRASLQQFESLLARAPESCDASVVFLRPDVADPSWEEAPLVQRAKCVSRLKIVWQTEAELAASYGELTSGHVMLWDARGGLLFSGGITASRGHDGASAGAAAILAHLRGEAAPAQTPVFGCALVSSVNAK